MVAKYVCVVAKRFKGGVSMELRDEKLDELQMLIDSLFNLLCELVMYYEGQL